MDTDGRCAVCVLRCGFRPFLPREIWTRHQKIRENVKKALERKDKTSA